MTFDEQVAALRGKLPPKDANKRKSDCTPEEWAASLDYVSQKGKRRYASNTERIREKIREYRNANIEKVRETARKSSAKWRANNAEKARAYRKHRQKNDAWYRVTQSLRRRQRQFFKGEYRSMSLVREVGCDRQFFLRHIESQFHSGMTMENYGSVWHLDHVFPLSQANIMDNPIHFLAVANWRNLRPMLGSENMAKQDTVTPEAQELFDLLCREFSSLERADQ